MMDEHLYEKNWQFPAEKGWSFSGRRCGSNLKFNCFNGVQTLSLVGTQLNKIHREFYKQITLEELQTGWPKFEEVFDQFFTVQLLIS